MKKRKHERIIRTVVHGESLDDLYRRFHVSCACGKMDEEEFIYKRGAVMAYRQHIDEALAKPSPFEPEVTTISDKYLYSEGGP